MTNDLFLAVLAMDSYNRTGGLSTVGLVLRGRLRAPQVESVLRCNRL
jgi:hypothetical protein